MAFDSRAGDVVIYGGTVLQCQTGGSLTCYFGAADDTWAYTPASGNWTDMSPTVSPPARVNPGMVYDDRAARVILFGGERDNCTTSANGTSCGSTIRLNDTWSYDESTNTWTDLQPANAPPSGGTMVYDSRADRIVLFDGRTWTYDARADTWTARSPPESPPWIGPVAYDSRTDRVVMLLSLFGSPSWFVWSYDYTNDTWTNVSASDAPPPSFDASVAYDSAADRVVVFGGVVPLSYPPGAAASTNDTWVYDPTSTTWMNVSGYRSPPARTAAGMVYDPTSDRAILFGGLHERVGTLGLYNDTWSFCYGCVVGPSNPGAAPANLALAAVVGGVLLGLLVAAVVVANKNP